MVEVDINDILLGLAEIAISVAGFSGLVVAIRSSSMAWHPRDFWSLTWMLGASMGAVFMALLPILIASLGASATATWVIADVILGTFMASFAALMATYDMRLRKRGHPPRVSYFPAAAMVLFISCSAFALVAGFGSTPLRVGAFVLGVSASLVAASLSLVVFIVVLAQEASKRSGDQVVIGPPGTLQDNKDRSSTDSVLEE